MNMFYYNLYMYFCNDVICIQIISYDEVSRGWDWSDVQKFCGRQLPRQLVLNNANKLRIIFHSNNDVNGDGFSVRKTLYEILR